MGVVNENGIKMMCEVVLMLSMEILFDSEFYDRTSIKMYGPWLFMLGCAIFDTIESSLFVQRDT